MINIATKFINSLIGKFIEKKLMEKFKISTNIEIGSISISEGDGGDKILIELEDASVLIPKKDIKNLIL